LVAHRNFQGGVNRQMWVLFWYIDHTTEISKEKNIFMNNALVAAFEAQNFKDWPLNILF